MSLAIDGVQDAYDTLRDGAPTPVDSLYDEESGRELEKIVDRLNAFYRPGDTTAVDLPSS